MPQEVLDRVSLVETVGADRLAAAQALTGDGKLAVTAVNSILGFATHLFTFKENSGPPGRVLIQRIPVAIPPGTAGSFTSIGGLYGAYTTSDFRKLTERPLGQIIADTFLDGSDLVCKARLTDSNADDPIQIQVIATIVFVG